MVRASKSKQESLSDITEHFYKLKEIPRTGWKQKLEIENAESVASHTLLMIVLVFFSQNNLDILVKKKLGLLK